MKIQLVENWRQAHKWLSVQLAALIGLLSLGLDYAPQLAQYLPQNWMKWAAVAFIVARVIRQKSQEKPNA